MTSLRIASPLPPDLEQLIANTIGVLIGVHRELGPGMSERVYKAAVSVELTDRRIPFELEKAVPVRYRNRILCHQFIDLLVDRRLVVELKVVERLHPVHISQVVNYMRLVDARAGLLVNFNVPLLKEGIKRLVL